MNVILHKFCSTLRVVDVGDFTSFAASLLPPIASLHWGLFMFSPSDFGDYTDLNGIHTIKKALREGLNKRLILFNSFILQLLSAY